MDALCDELLHFWFGDLSAPDEQIAERQAALWWGAAAETDEIVRARFSDLHRRATRGELSEWKQTPRGRLASIIALDQLSRNLFRGRAEAFAHDELARAWTAEAIEAGQDRLLRPIERVFVYLPLEHSENLADQEWSVRAYEQLAREVEPRARATFDEYLDFAVRHRDIVRTFGRFPHRNASLGRPSTPAELAFLSQPGSSF
jgi:uncharacterized protein (DUF924 family)